MKSFLGDLRKVGFSLKFKNEKPLVVIKSFLKGEAIRSILTALPALGMNNNVLELKCFGINKNTLFLIYLSNICFNF